MFAQTSYEKAEKLYSENKLSEAKKLFEEYLKDNPNHIKTIEYLGDIAGKEKKWDDAISYYKKLKIKQPSSANYWYKYGGAMGMKAKNVNKFKALGMISDIEEAFLKARLKYDVFYMNDRGWYRIKRNKLYETPNLAG